MNRKREEKDGGGERHESTPLEKDLGGSYRIGGPGGREKDKTKKTQPVRENQEKKNDSIFENRLITAHTKGSLDHWFLKGERGERECIPAKPGSKQKP